MTPIALSRATLRAFGPGLHVPAYDPTTITPGIVHLGLGGFARAHIARYTHDLMNQSQSASEWGIIGAGLLPADRRMRAALAPQDGLYALVERGREGETITIIGTIAEMIFAGESSAALLGAIDRPAVRIVSLTVTEDGYCLNRATKRLDLDHPDIRADLAHPRAPKSAIGILAEAYRRRHVSGRRAFTALSCDNIQHNGTVLRRALLDYTANVDHGLTNWIERAASFPNTMVDRITPITMRADIADLAERHGVIDRWPVFTELFRQWVIEDDFADGRPAWEAAGALFVETVEPYELMKLRLLNASHLAIAALGRLAGYQFVSQTMRDDRVRGYMIGLMARELAPTLLPVPGVDLVAYQAALVERFANPSIRDTVERVNTDAPLNYLLDPIRDRLKSGASVELLALALAAWLRRMRGVDERGETIEIRHPLASLLRERAIEGGPDPRPMMKIEPLFGELGESRRLIAEVAFWLTSLNSLGAAATLECVQARLRL